MNNQVI